MSDKLAAVITELTKSRNMQKAAWQRVIEAGRAYAQMKAHGSYIERGSLISVCFSDRERMVKHFSDNLLSEVERAFTEDALMGAALADQT